ncbi:MAG: tail fiber domain-containing protein [Bacteroidota bacterium]
MKKILLSITLVCSLTSITQAQNVGIGTNTPKAAFNVAENKTVLFGNDTGGSGSKMMWIPAKYAFRAGAIGNQLNYYAYTADSTIWDYDSIGAFSFASGYQNKAIGLASSTMGFFNEVRGGYATAMGSNNKNIGWYSFSAGASNQSLGTGSICVGSQNISRGLCSFAAGKENEVAGDNSVALGYQNHSNGNYSTVIGLYNNVSGVASVAIGYNNNITGLASSGLGQDNIVNSNLSTAIGIANATNSYGMMALGLYSDTIAGGNRLGWVSTDPLFIIGNGNGAGARNNAMTILKNGKTGFGTNTPAGLLHIKHNGQAANPQLVVEEAQNDYSRISFKNANPGYWNIEAYSKPILGSNDVAKFNFFYSANGYIFSLSGNGNATLTGTLYQNSDESLKQNISPIKNSLGKLMQLNGYNYQWKDTARGTEEQVGLLAQEVEKQFPQLVMTDEQGKKSVAYANMVPVLLQAIKEQQQQIDELKRLAAASIK